MLNAKIDADGKAVTYTYDAAGRMSSRIWARGLTTDYSYDPLTGELTGVDYEDPMTPDITNIYNRRGLLDSVTQGTGLSADTRTFEYCICGKVHAEHLGTLHDNRILTYHLDSTGTGTKGRTTGYSLTDSTGTTTLHRVDYGFDGLGRFDTLTTGGSMGTHVFDYDYHPDSNIVTS